MALLMVASNPIWYPSPNLIAQLAHVGWGFLLVMATLFIGRWRKWADPVAAAVMVVAMYAEIKEFAFDIYIEKDPFMSSAKDFAFYMVGIAAAFGLHEAWKRLRKK
jgi:hypothetical protein